MTAKIQIFSEEPTKCAFYRHWTDSTSLQCSHHVLGYCILCSSKMKNNDAPFLPCRKLIAIGYENIAFAKLNRLRFYNIFNKVVFPSSSQLLNDRRKNGSIIRGSEIQRPYYSSDLTHCYFFFLDAQKCTACTLPPAPKHNLRNGIFRLVAASIKVCLKID